MPTGDSREDLPKVKGRDETSDRASETAPGIRALGGWVCPRCHRRVDSVAENEILRCSGDGMAFVPAADLADAPDDPFLGATVAGRYVIVGRLGAGSMGTVYRARQEAMGRSVALKVLRSERAIDANAKARFTREARAMSLLTSPHTVTVFDFGEIQEEPGRGSLFLALALLEGESLGDRLKVRRRLRVHDALAVTRQVLMSLAEAHDKGVIHRDLKPDNLFLTKSPEAEVLKVLDFGIAKLVSGELPGVDAAETQAGTVFGTPRYMSPEQAQAKPLDARSDLYSLGVLLYHMLVGRPPFMDDDAVVVMARHIKTRPTPPAEAAPEAGIPAAVSELVMRVLSKDPDGRPASARAFLAEIDAVMGSIGISAGASGEVAAVVHEKPPRVGIGSRRRLIVGGSAAVAIVVVAGFLSSGRPDTGSLQAPERLLGAGVEATERLPPAPSALATAAPPAALGAIPSSTPEVAPPAPGPATSSSARPRSSGPMRALDRRPPSPAAPAPPPPATPARKSYVKFD